MSELETQFKEAAERVKTLEKKPDNETLLKLYALYKQVTVGVVNTSQPWAVQLEARAKWDAWYALGSMDRNTAMTKYVSLVNSLFA